MRFFCAETYSITVNVPFDTCNASMSILQEVSHRLKILCSLGRTWMLYITHPWGNQTELNQLARA